MDTSLFHENSVSSDRILYTPSDFAKTNLIHLQETGELRAIRPHTSTRKNLSSFLFFLVLEGEGTLDYNGASYALAAGDCVFLDCRKPYSHSTKEHLWRLMWCHFYGPNLSGIYEKYVERGGRPCFHASTEAQSRYRELLTELYRIASSDLYIRDMKIFEKLSSLLTLLMEESWNPGRDSHTSSKRRDLQYVKDYLDRHYAEKIRLEELAGQFYINKFYLARIFKEQFGLTAGAYLLEVRITHAKQLLRFSDLPVEKIAAECGMADANYFSRMFKKVEGMTPGEFRRKW